MQRAAIGRPFRHRPDKIQPAKGTSVENDKKMKNDSVKSSSSNPSSKEKQSSEKRSNPPTDAEKSSRRKVGAKPVPVEKKPLDPETAQKWLDIEQRILQATFGLGLFVTLLFLIAVVTEYWVKVDMNVAVLTNDTERQVTFYRMGYNHGLWRVCEQEFYNSTVNVNQVTGMIYPYCSGLILFSSDPKIDPVTMHFRRSCCAIGIVALIVSAFANVGSWYSLRSFRYIYKRLAGILHFITGACCWITVEVFKQSIQYEQSKSNFTKTVTYHFSYYFGWICFSFFLIVGLVLLVFSRKRKGDQARSLREAAENEPVNIGRI